MKKILLMGLVAGLLLFFATAYAANGVEDSAGYYENITFFDDTPLKDTEDVFLQFSVTAHSENTLMAFAQVDIYPAASVSIEFSSENTTTRMTGPDDFGSKHLIPVIGMRAQTNYSMTAVATFLDGSKKRSDPIPFTTGALPTDTPTINLTASSEKSEGGITFFGTNPGWDATALKRYWGVDEQGEVVWYLHGDYSIARSPAIRVLEPGVLWIFLQDSVRIINSVGDTLAEYGLDEYHHDAILLPNGNVMYFGTENIENSDGITLTSFNIIEKNSQGEIIWEWSAFDHLDTNRFPGFLSTAESNSGGLDWSHANSLYYVADEEAIVVSVRSQSWVVKIDYQTGDIIWIMGDNIGTAEDYPSNDRFFTLESGTWMGNQHAVLGVGDSEIMMFDNRTETGGKASMSRAVKYRLDESLMTVNQTWEVIAPKFARSMGDVDILNNGNILICAGGAGVDPNAHIVEVTPDASAETVWSITVDTTVYRAERMSWRSFLNSTF